MTIEVEIITDDGGPVDDEHIGCVATWRDWGPPYNTANLDALLTECKRPARARLINRSVITVRNDVGNISDLLRALVASGMRETVCACCDCPLYTRQPAGGRDLCGSCQTKTRPGCAGCVS